jgi:predicted transcriptional regulator
MKMDSLDITLTVTKEELKDALERKVRVAVSQYCESWNVERQVKDIINQEAPQILQELIREKLQDSEALKEQVRKALENKLKAQLTKVLKEG